MSRRRLAEPGRSEDDGGGASRPRVVSDLVAGLDASVARVSTTAATLLLRAAFVDAGWQ